MRQVRSFAPHRPQPELGALSQHATAVLCVTRVPQHLSQMPYLSPNPPMVHHGTTDETIWVEEGNQPAVAIEDRPLGEEAADGRKEPVQDVARNAAPHVIRPHAPQLVVDVVLLGAIGTRADEIAKAPS